MVSIGGVINGLTHYIMGGKKFKSFEDLRGANLGSSGLTSGTAFVLRRVLRAKGLEYPRDYNLINVGGSAQAFLSLTAGTDRRGDHRRAAQLRSGADGLSGDR